MNLDMPPHPHVVRLLGVSGDSLIFELAQVLCLSALDSDISNALQHGPLERHLKNLPSRLRWSSLCDVLSALVFLHEERGVVHCDLRPGPFNSFASR